MVLTYIDSSVALAYLFAESRFPPEGFWRQTLTSSRLLESEIWNRIHAHGSDEASIASARVLLSGVELLDMNRETLARALSRFPIALRTLDGLHLATLEFIRGRGEAVELASYDRRMLAAAAALGISPAPI